jgi:hypothetical protein
MVSFHIRNTTSRPLVLEFLKRPARLERAGTKYSSITVKLSDIDTSKRRSTETSLQLLIDNGCEIYLNTELKRLVPVTEPVAKPEEVKAPESTISAHTARNLDRAMSQQPNMPIREQALFQGNPESRIIGVLPNQPEPGRSVTVSREVSMSNMPGAKPGQFNTFGFNAEEFNKAKAKEARAGTAVPVAKTAAAEVETVPAPVTVAEAKKPRGRPRTSDKPVSTTESAPVPTVEV